MSGVKLVNETGQDITLYEGSGGVYRSLRTIPRGKEYVLRVDTNETYREYRCRLRDAGVSRKSEAVVLMPFVFAEYTQVTIKWDRNTDRLSYETKKKEAGSNAAADNPWLVHRLLNKFSWRREHAPSGSGSGGSGGSGSGGGADGDGGGDDANVPRRNGALDSQRPALSSMNEV